MTTERNMAHGCGLLTGERIYLREVRRADVNERYYAWLNDPEVNQFLETRFVPQSLEQIADFVASKDGKVDEPFLAICLRESDEHIGNIKLGPINWRHRYADVSLFIGEKAHWGRGYATEAIALITRFAMQTLALNKLRASCYEENQGSAKAFEKCGWRQEGLLRQHFFSGGVPTNAIVLGVTADDYWASLRKAA